VCCAFDYFCLQIPAPVHPQCRGNSRQELGEGVVFAGANDDRQVYMAALRSEESFVRRKSTITRKSRPQVIGIPVGVRIVTQLGVAELPEEVPEILCLSAAHELLWQLGLMKAYVPKRWMTQNVVPRIETRKGDVENHHASRTLRLEACKGVRHDSSDVVPENVDVFQAKTDYELMNVFG
jgi:hypothetical protein